MNKIKHILAEVDMDTYDHLRHTPLLKNTPQKETIHEAVVEYIKQHEEDIMDDSFFDVVGSFATTEGNWSEMDYWRE